MNDLSWMIYLAGVLPSAGRLLGFMAMLLMMSLFGLFVFTAASQDGYRSDTEKKKAWRKRQLDRLVPRASALAIPAIVCALISVAIPNERTIYLIAASEAGEAVATSEDGAEMLDQVKTILRGKLAEYIEPKE